MESCNFCFVLCNVLLYAYFLASAGKGEDLCVVNEFREMSLHLQGVFWAFGLIFLRPWCFNKQVPSLYLRGPFNCPRLLPLFFSLSVINVVS